MYGSMLKACEFSEVCILVLLCSSQFSVPHLSAAPSPIKKSFSILVGLQE